MASDEKGIMMASDERFFSAEKLLVAAKGDGAKAVPVSAKKKGRCQTFLSLWKYLNTTDYIVLCIGTVFAICHGASMPLFALFFGDATNALGNPSGTPPQGRYLKIDYPEEFAGTEELFIGDVSIKGYDITQASVALSQGFTDPAFPASNCIDGNKDTFCKSVGANPSLVIELTPETALEFSDLAVYTGLSESATLAGANIHIVADGHVPLKDQNYNPWYFAADATDSTRLVLDATGALEMDIGYTHSNLPISAIEAADGESSIATTNVIVSSTGAGDDEVRTINIQNDDGASFTLADQTPTITDNVLTEITVDGENYSGAISTISTTEEANWDTTISSQTAQEFCDAIAPGCNTATFKLVGSLTPLSEAWETYGCNSADGCVFVWDVEDAPRATWTGTFIGEKTKYKFAPGDGFMDAMIDVVWKMGIVAGIVFVGGSIHTTCFVFIAERSANKLRREYLACILSRDMAWFDVNDVATIPSKLISQVTSFQDAIGDKFGRLIMVQAQFIAGLAVGFYYNMTMTAILFASCFPFMLLGGGGFAVNMEKLKNEGGHGYGKARAVAEEALFSIKTVAAFGGESKEIARYSEPLGIAKKAGVSLAGWTGFFFGVLFAGFGFAYAATFWYAGEVVVYRDTNPRASSGSFPLYDQGAIMTVFFSVLIGLMGVSDAGQPVGALFEGMGAATLIWETMDNQPDIEEDAAKKTVVAIEKRSVEQSNWAKLLRATGNDDSAEVTRVEFKNVLFTYPSRPGQLILNKLNLTFEGGQKVALVGESGSGKSTCMQLFLKFYNADAGELLIHGPSGPVNINTIPAAKWRQLIGYVGQEPVLFKGSIYDNVTSRDDSVPLEDVIWAIKTAEAAEFVKDKAREAAQNKSKDSKKSSGSEYVDVEEEDKLIAKGLKTVLGQGGGGLSGGQKQRIAIARAIVLRGKRKMLLLDEATSALDNKTEFEVQGTIDNVVAEQKMTTITIAHRLSTIQSSDKIFVMQRGEVMDHGTHEELIADEGAMRSGIYKALWAGQASQKDHKERRTSYAEIIDISKEETGESDSAQYASKIKRKTSARYSLKRPSMGAAEMVPADEDSKKKKGGLCGGSAAKEEKPDEMAIIQDLIAESGQEMDPLGDQAILLLLEYEKATSMDDKAVEARRLEILGNKDVFALVGQNVKECHHGEDYFRAIDQQKCVIAFYSSKKQSSATKKALDIFGQLSGKFRNLKFLKVDLEKLEGEIGISFPGCNRKSKEAFFHLYPEGEDAKKVEASGANQLEQLVYMHFSTVKIIEKSSSLEFKDALEDHWMVCQCGTNASDELKFNYAKLAGEFDNVLFIQAPHADHGPDKFSIYKRNTVIHDGSIGSLKELEETLLSEGGRKIIVKISKYNDMIKKYSGHLWYLYIIGSFMALASGANFPLQGFFLALGIQRLSVCMPCFVQLDEYSQYFASFSLNPNLIDTCLEKDYEESAFVPLNNTEMFLVQGQPDWTQDNCREKCLTLTADDCLQVGIYFIILAVSAVFFEMGCAFIFGYIGETITQKLRIEAFTSVVKQSVGFHDAPENTPGSLTADLETKTSKVSKIAGPNIGKQLGMMCGLIMGLTLGFALGNPILALIILGMVPFLMMAMIFVMTLMYVGEVGGASPFSEAGQVSSEAIMNVRTVRALNNEDTVVERFMEICTPISDKSRKNAWKTGLAFGFSQCIFFAIYIAAFGFGGLLIEDADQCSNEAAEKGNEVFKTLFCIMFGVMEAGLAASMLPDAMRANVALYDIFKIINRKSDINVFEPNGSRTNINAEVALVAFDNVQFFYPHRPNVQVLKGLTFEVQQGQTAAFCGPSGSGKSTVISLLQRFYDPQGGRVLVGGIDLRKYDISWWRQNIGFVGQEPVLFNLSVEENIRYGKLFDSESITSEQCVAAAKIANCNFITEVGMDAGHGDLKSRVGLGDDVGSFGGKLSGGQKQRVAIARAMIRDPKILLLDEATSALDTTSEKVVQNALEQVRAARPNMTTFIIAHRLSTIQDADVILVLSGGVIIEKGDHPALMALEGTYTKLVEAAKKSGC